MMATENNRAPTAEEWERMFDEFSAHLLDLERISLDPEVDSEVQEEARAELNEGVPLLRDMKRSRGFTPGRVRL